MSIKTIKTLEFDKILEILADMAVSEKVKERLINLSPYLKEDNVLLHINQTTQGKRIIENSGNPPIAKLDNIYKVLQLTEQKAVLNPEDLESISRFIATCRRMKTYLMKSITIAPDIASYSGSIYELNILQDEISSGIRNGKVDDRASGQLAGIRRKIANTSEQIKLKINQMLAGNKAYLSENFVSYRNGHYTLPVKSQYKNKIKGSTIDISASGNTHFIEPAAIYIMHSKLDLLKIEEENEVIRILCRLTEMVEENAASIKINIEAMEILDFIFAKSKLSIKMKAVAANVVTEPQIILKKGRHPFINEKEIVPLDFEMNNADRRCVIITGPNTGGKTVVLKTIGLFSLMTQSGLHIPAEEAVFSMQNMVLCDIGDGQSITENLSTFSSHITNIIEIIGKADEQSLVILDELGSGTDPTEGMGIAVAILEELAKKKCLLLATTHYPEIKKFAENTTGFINARMGFDKENLKPLYKLMIGEAGESCALYIAKRLGMPQIVIKNAYNAAYNRKNNEENKIIYDKELLEESTDAVKIETTFGPKIQKRDNKTEKQKETTNIFAIGDSVMVYPEKETGIIYQIANCKGEFGVIIKKEKMLINHKRIKLLVSAGELYPEDYDMSIVFDTVANRKARKTMSKRHDPDAVVIIKE